MEEILLVIVVLDVSKPSLNVVTGGAAGGVGLLCEGVKLLNVWREAALCRCAEAAGLRAVVLVAKKDAVVEDVVEGVEVVEGLDLREP